MATLSRYKTDPEFRARKNKLVKKRHLERMATDPEYAERSRAWLREYKKRYYKAQYDSDPQHREKMKAHGKFHHMFRELVCMMREEVRPMIGCTFCVLALHES